MKLKKWRTYYIYLRDEYKTRIIIKSKRKRYNKRSNRISLLKDLLATEIDLFANGWSCYVCGAEYKGESDYCSCAEMAA